MDQRFIQQQTQKLVLSPQMRQYLQLLQMPILELQQAIEQELASNPALEDVVEDRRLTERSEDNSKPDAGPAGTERDSNELNFGEAYDRLSRIEDAYAESDDFKEVRSKDSEELQRSKDYQDSLITKPPSLNDYLLWQLRFLDLSEKEIKIAEEIIGNIGEDGYLKATLEEISGATGAETPKIETLLSKIQEFDPPGIGARNLQEALLIQLRKQNIDTALAQTIVKDHLPLLEKRDWPQIAKALHAAEDDIREAVKLIIRLEPRPGRSFLTHESLAIVPDSTVYLDPENGELKLDIHDERIPELRINPYYRKLLRDSRSDEKTKQFLKEKIQAAMNLLKSIQLRRSTLREISEAIMKEQPDFFTHGFSHLKPLRLKDVAGRIGIHESTVSRAIQGKYMVTPQGTIPYKSFFSVRLDTTDGQNESQKSIMERIRLIVSKEKSAHPLSDEDIVNTLKSEGVVIARRTVAKYRDILKILPSHLRRKK